MLFTWLSGYVADLVVQLLSTGVYSNGCVKSLPAVSELRPPMAKNFPAGGGGVGVGPCTPVKPVGEGVREWLKFPEKKTPTKRAPTLGKSCPVNQTHAGVGVGVGLPPSGTKSTLPTAGAVVITASRTAVMPVSKKTAAVETRSLKRKDFEVSFFFMVETTGSQSAANPRRESRILGEMLKPVNTFFPPGGTLYWIPAAEECFARSDQSTLRGSFRNRSLTQSQFGEPDFEIRIF